MYPHIRRHTNSQLPSVGDYLSVFPSQYTVSAGPPLSIDQTSWFPYDLKAFELLSVQLNSSAFCFFKSRLFISLFLLQWGGLVRNGSPAISPRCTLPSCCFALIKKLLNKRRAHTGSLVRKQHFSHWDAARLSNSCRLAWSQSHFCHVCHYACDRNDVTHLPHCAIGEFELRVVAFVWPYLKCLVCRFMQTKRENEHWPNVDQSQDGSLRLVVVLLGQRCHQRRHSIFLSCQTLSISKSFYGVLQP